MCSAPDRPAGCSERYCAAVCFQPYVDTSNLKCVQNGPYLVFDSAPPGALGANNRAQGGFGFPQFPVNQNVIVIFVPADLFGRFPEPACDHVIAIFAPRAEPLL